MTATIEDRLAAIERRLAAIEARSPDYRPGWHPGWTARLQDCACPPNTACGNAACPRGFGKEMGNG